MAKIHVKTQQEIKKFVIEESIFLYKDLNFLEKRRILFPHLLNGKLTQENSFEFMYEVVSKIITGWENVLDENDNPIEFKKEYLKGLDPKPVYAFFDAVVTPMYKEIIQLKDDIVGSAPQKESQEFKDELAKELKKNKGAVEKIEESRDDEIKN